MKLDADFPSQIQNIVKYCGTSRYSNGRANAGCPRSRWRPPKSPLSRQGTPSRWTAIFSPKPSPTLSSLPRLSASFTRTGGSFPSSLRLIVPSTMPSHPKKSAIPTRGYSVGVSLFAPIRSRPSRPGNGLVHQADPDCSRVSRKLETQNPRANSKRQVLKT
jgi:hypothetical protein